MRLNLSSRSTVAEEAALAAAAVDVAAAGARARYADAALGPGDIAAAKRAEAVAYKAANFPKPVDANTYPFIAAEADATGKNPTAVCNAILNAHGAWVSKAARIEAQRVKGRAAVGAAGTKAALYAAKAAALAAIAAVA